MVNPAGRRIVNMLEVLALVTLLAMFGRVAYGKFYRPPADVLDAGADPRLMVVDLVSLQQLAQSTRLAHRVTFDLAPDGSVDGYSISYPTSFGDPWATLRSRPFPARVRVTSSQPYVEFDADGGVAHRCEITFDLSGRRWLISMAEGTGELRLLEIGRAPK